MAERNPTAPQVVDPLERQINDNRLVHQSHRPDTHAEFELLNSPVSENISTLSLI